MTAPTHVVEIEGTLTPEPGETVVCRLRPAGSSASYISTDACERVRAQLLEKFPDNEVLVILGDEMTLGVEPAPNPQRAVREFHEAFDLVVRDKVQGDLHPAERQLRTTLILEEVAELLCAIAGRGEVEALKDRFVEAFAEHQRKAPWIVVDVAEIARESADVLNVVYGAALHYGFDLDAAFAEVMRSCMAKRAPDGTVNRRADGKVLKPEGWEPPNVARAIGLDVTNPRGNDGLEGPGSDRNAGADRRRVEEGSPSAGAPGGSDGGDVAEQGARRGPGRADQGARSEGTGVAPRSSGRAA